MTVNWLQDYSLLMFDKIDSTNLEAKRLICQPIKGSYVIQAHEQSSGIASNKRVWESPAGNLYMSILLPTAPKISRSPQICFIAANAVYRALDDLCSQDRLSNGGDGGGYELHFKWPNDILLNRKKVAGILIESLEANDAHYIVIGIGVNIALTPILEASDVRHFTPTSLHTEGIMAAKSIAIDSNMVLDLIMKNFDPLYHKWLADKNFFSMRNFWIQRSIYLNQPVVVENQGQKNEGILRDLALDGALVLEKENGQLEYIYSGSLFAQDFLPQKNKI
jgi:BirA family biotin operon repressor/biotin-[acetyl-CoA-carboxylase] ligase